MFEKWVLRRIYGPRTDEVAGEWKRLHNEESAANNIPVITQRRMRWAEHVARMGASTAAYWVLVGVTEARRPFERPRRRSENNIKMDLQDVGWKGRDWINPAQGRDMWQAPVYAVMNLRVPQNAGNSLTSRGRVNFSQRTLLYEVSTFTFLSLSTIKDRHNFTLTTKLTKPLRRVQTQTCSVITIHIITRNAAFFVQRSATDVPKPSNLRLIFMFISHDQFQSPVLLTPCVVDFTSQMGLR